MPEFERIPPRQKPLHTSQTSYVMKDINGSSALFENVETTILDADFGARTIEQKSAYVAGCGHTIGLRLGPADLGGQCEKCGCSTCAVCSSIRCNRCHALTCPTCCRVSEGIVLCRRCTWIVRAKVLLRLGHEALSKDIHK